MTSVHLTGAALKAAVAEFSDSGIVSVASLAGDGGMLEGWGAEARRPTGAPAIGKAVHSKLTLG